MDVSQVIGTAVCVLWLLTFTLAMLVGSPTRLIVAEVLGYSPLWFFPPVVIGLLLFDSSRR